MSQKILNKRSSVFGKTPLPSQIEVGEIAINFNHENPFLSILDSNGEIQKFLSETKTRGLIQDAKEDIDNSFYTKEEINNMFEAFDPSGEVDLDNYYTKRETDNLLAGKSDSAHTHDYSQILNTPDLSNFATLSDIPSINGLASEVWVGENYQPKGNYLTEHQSLENYYTKSEADNKFLTSHQDLSSYAQKSDLDDYLTISSASTIYATKEELEEFTPTVDAYSKAETDILLAGYSTTAHTHDYSEIQNTPDLSGFASLSDIPDTSNFITSAFTEEHYMKIGSTPTDVYTKAESDSKFQPQSGMTDYALKSEIPSTTGLASETWVSNNFSTTAHTHSEYAEKTDLANYMPNSGMTDYALKSEIPNSYTKTEADNLLAGKANSAHTHTVSDITDLNIPSVEGLASEEWVSNNFSSTAHTHSDLATKAELDDYLTIASASTTYATKEELEEFTPSDNYAGTVWAGTLAEYNNLTVIDTDTLYVITDANQQYVTSGQVESMTSGYTNLTEVQTLLEGYSTTSHTHSYNDLEDKPTIPSTTGLASETWVSQNFQPQSAMTEYSLSGHTHSQYLTETSADTRYARVVSLTQTQYDALVQNDQVEQGVLYCIIEQSNS